MSPSTQWWDSNLLRTGSLTLGLTNNRFFHCHREVCQNQLQVKGVHGEKLRTPDLSQQPVLGILKKFQEKRL